jgi:1-aminocyclopropane-1-carboxylate deaminase/D-cysteine desulfhydrase-like pyridoxal-dependent ACC family enzyme
MASGSGGTQAGIGLAAAMLGWRGSVLGISVGASSERQRAKVANIRDPLIRGRHTDTPDEVELRIGLWLSRNSSALARGCVLET